MIVILIDT